MFFGDFTALYNDLNTELQGKGHTANRLSVIINSFERKLEVFFRDVETKKFKYFFSLKGQLELMSSFADKLTFEDTENILKRYLDVLENSKQIVSTRFSQFRDLEKTLQFISKPRVAKMSDLEVTFFDWLNIDNLEMELIEFQESSTWVKKIRQTW
jgi:hypothetical protein